MIYPYKGKNYEIDELRDAEDGKSLDQIAIFEIVYKQWDNKTKKFERISHGLYTQEQQREWDRCDLMEDKIFIDWYYGEFDEKETIRLIEEHQNKKNKKRK